MNLMLVMKIVFLILFQVHGVLVSVQYWATLATHHSRARFNLTCSLNFSQFCVAKALWNTFECLHLVLFVRCQFEFFMVGLGVFWWGQPIGLWWGYKKIILTYVVRIDLSFTRIYLNIHCEDYLEHGLSLIIEFIIVW